MRPLFLTLVRVSHSCRLAAGSTPVDGSSKNTTGGSPMRAMAVLSLRLLPPLEKFEKIKTSTLGNNSCGYLIF